jgi:hypothetical protein
LGDDPKASPHVKEAAEMPSLHFEALSFDLGGADSGPARPISAAREPVWLFPLCDGIFWIKRPRGATRQRGAEGVPHAKLEQRENSCMKTSPTWERVKTNKGAFGSSGLIQSTTLVAVWASMLA